MKSYTPTRKTLLIGAQTPKGDHLPGVPADMERMKEFFVSPNGGSWNDNEITTSYNEPRTKVLSRIAASVADYTIIHCATHGYTNKHGELMICLADGDIPAAALLNNSPRQLIIPDTCRKRERGATIGGILWPEEEWLYATGYSFARELYDQYINDSAFGKIMIYATDDDNYAYESRHRNGGEFTLSLLDSVFAYQQSGQQGPLFINDVAGYATSLLHRRNVKQTPSVVYQEGHFNAPFAIVSPTFLPIEREKKAVVKPKKTSEVEGLLFCAGVLVTAYALSKIL